LAAFCSWVPNRAELQLVSARSVVRWNELLLISNWAGYSSAAVSAVPSVARLVMKPHLPYLDPGAVAEAVGAGSLGAVTPAPEVLGLPDFPVRKVWAVPPSAATTTTPAP